ncbi:hypothetical protein GCM10020219_057370 [Nonomuraea dietziae]
MLRALACGTSHLSGWREKSLRGRGAMWTSRWAAKRERCRAVKSGRVQNSRAIAITGTTTVQTSSTEPTTRVAITPAESSPVSRPVATWSVRSQVAAPQWARIRRQMVMRPR